MVAFATLILTIAIAAPSTPSCWSEGHTVYPPRTLQGVDRGLCPAERDWAVGLAA
jgi:hypothetical protein